MLPDTSIDDIDVYADAENSMKTLPSTNEYLGGAVASQCVPAGWWNWLFNALTARAKAAHYDVDKILTELGNVLRRLGEEPDPDNDHQLADVVASLKPGIAGLNTLGIVRSNNGLNNVSVTSDGTMVANGVGDLTTASIVSVGGVQDIVSAINYLTRQIYSYGVYTPENTLDQSKRMYVRVGSYQGARQQATGESSAEISITDQEGEFTLPGGHWYRFCLLSALGGNSGTGGRGTSDGWYSGRSSGSAGTQNGQTVGAITSYGGVYAMFDLYLKTDTKCSYYVGSKGKNGGNGGNGSITTTGSSGTGRGGTGGTGGAAPDFNAQKIARLPSFLHSVAGGRGTDGNHSENTASSSSGSTRVAVASGGSGGNGSNGDGIALCIGNNVFSVSGGKGGSGQYTMPVSRSYTFYGTASASCEGVESVDSYAYANTPTLAAMQKVPIVHESRNGQSAWAPVGAVVGRGHFRNSVFMDDDTQTPYLREYIQYDKDSWVQMRTTDLDIVKPWSGSAPADPNPDTGSIFVWIAD